VRNISMMGESGSHWLTHVEVCFEGCCVPLSNQIGAEGDGFVLPRNGSGPGRIHHCIRWIGFSERVETLPAPVLLRQEQAPSTQRSIGVKRLARNSASTRIVEKPGVLLT